MKKLICTLFLCVILAAPGLARERSIFGASRTVIGGFGGPVLKITDINGDIGALVGGRGGWILNHSLTLGAGGYLLASDLDLTPKVAPLDEVPIPEQLKFGYGGFEMGYVIRPKELVHFSFNTLLGAGNVRLENFEDNFFVVEPALNMEINVTPNMRLGMGLSYRLVNGVDDNVWVNDADLTNTVGVITLKFGKF
ncbi:MAG: hypothetical protein D6675_11880 [Gemmatimonadetes bacterium]|nr:MAG: hypothetical protein D6675_11880 [Gemmatimonadota bacterium]